MLHVRRGALLHDIGKIGVRDAVLLKPGPLDQQEWVEMKEHPQLGWALLQRIETDMLHQSRDVRQTTEYSYRRGQSSFVEFLDAQRAFNDTMQSYNNARADYARSLYVIDSVSGKAVTP